jgi:hypothetical protein
MPALMIKCPKTQKLVATGLTMAKRSFKDSYLNDNSLKCPACGDNHTWNKKDVLPSE